MKRREQDSMGLMIDTMCNGVGGLVLVAILIVLISISESPSSAEGQMQRKQLENEVEALKIREELLRADNARMSENSSDLSEELVDSISNNEIEAQLALMQARKQKVQELEAQLLELKRKQAQAKVADPGQYVAAELEVLNQMRDEAAKLGAKLKIAQDSLAAFEADYSELLSEVADVKERKSRTLKTTVERSYDRFDFFYFRYGKCYMFPQESQASPGRQFVVLEENETTIVFEPKKGAGVSIESISMRDFLSFVKRNNGTCQLGFYPDSFDLYLPMMAKVDEYNLSYGVGFYTDKLHPGFTSAGGTPIMGQGQ